MSNTNRNSDTNADISREQLIQILKNVYGYEQLPSEKQATDTYWDTVLKEANITPAQYEELLSKYVKRNSLGILEIISSSAANNFYVPISRVAAADTASYYQVLDTDFTYFTDITVADDLILPQNGTFFIRPNQADAHIQYGTQYVAYFVNDGKIFVLPNYQTLEVELVERKLTYDSIQILENPYVDAIIKKFTVRNWPNRLNDWKTSFPSIAVYRPFPPSNYILQTSHDRVREGQQVLVRLVTQRVPAGKKYRYTIEGIDSADVDVPLNGILVTSGSDATAVALLRVNTSRDKRTDGDKTMIISVDVPYDQTYGGGVRLEESVDILERSKSPAVLTDGNYVASNAKPTVNLRSGNDRYTVVYQGDGNFVIGDTNTANALRAIGYGSRTFGLQLDGNAVWRDDNGTTIDNTATSTNGPTYFRIGDDGILRLFRMLDDVEIWNSVSNLVSPGMVSTFNSNLNVLAGQLTNVNNLTNIRNIFNALPQQTRNALLRNSAPNSLAFQDPNGPLTNATITAMRTALNGYLAGNQAIINNVLFTASILSFNAYKAKLINDSTELNLPDIPQKPGAFVIANTPAPDTSSPATAAPNSNNTGLRI